MNCPDTSASHGCPKTCYYKDDSKNDNNSNELFLCTEKENQMGCKPEEHCVRREKDSNGEYCPDIACPVQCDSGEILCPNGIASNGCKHPDVCFKKVMDLGGMPCERQCPQVCEEWQISCAVELLLNGCPGINSCTDKVSFGTDKTGEQCPAYCIPTCPEGTTLTQGGHGEDGCKIPPTCTRGKYYC